MKTKITRILAFSLITGLLWLMAPTLTRAGESEVGTLDSITSPNGSPNTESNPADGYINVYGTTNTGSLGELTLQTCGGYIYINNAYSGDFTGSLAYFTVDVSGLVNGSYTLRIEPNNCGGYTATGTNTLTFYVSHPVTATINVTNNCRVDGAPAGSWTSNPAGVSGSGAGGSYTVTSDSSGTTYSLSFTPPTTYTGSVSPSSQLVYPGGTYLFTTSCTHYDPPTVSISATPSTLQCTDPLSSTAITWNVANATSCSATGDWTGAKDATTGSHTENVTPSGSTSGATSKTYGITCTGPGGTVSATPATVSVGQCTAPQASVALSASPTSIASGGSSLLSWTGTNIVAGSCSAWWTSSTATSGTQTVSPSVTTDYSISCTATSAAGGGAVTSNTATVTVTPGASVSVSANPADITSGQSSTITWSSTNATSCSAPWTSSTATSGTQTVSPTTSTTYSMTCSGPGGSGTGSATVTISSSNPAFSYSLSNAGNVSVTKDGADVFVNQTITRTAVSGTQSPVTVAITSTLPSGVTASISNNPCPATCNSTITFTVTQNAQTGTFPVTVTGSASGVTNQTTTFNLTIYPSASVTVSCLASPSPARVGLPVVWTAYPSGGTLPYTYLWTGTNFPSPAPTSSAYTITYQSTGSKTAQVTVRDQNGTGTSAQCPVTQLQVNVNPTFKEF
ncbi:MAG: hypothetical protein WA051_01920 [Minisyncoccia bacterium]